MRFLIAEREQREPRQRAPSSSSMDSSADPRECRVIHSKREGEGVDTSDEDSNSLFLRDKRTEEHRRGGRREWTERQRESLRSGHRED
jgi:hypothetical protein